MKSFFKQVSFKVKLIGLCLLLSSVSIVIGVFSFRGLHKVEQSYEKIVDDVMPNMNLVNNMFLSYRAVRVNLRSLGLPGLPKEEAEDAVKHTISAIEDYEKFAKAYNEIPFVEGEKELYDEVHKNWMHFKAIGMKALSLYKSGNPEDIEQLMKIYFDDCPKAAKMYTESIDKIKQFHEAHGNKYSQEAKASASQANQFVLLTAIIGIFAGVSIGVIFAIGLSKSIVVVTENLAKNAEQVTSASAQIASSSEELSNASTEQAASLEETAASLEQISAMIAKASESASSTATSSNESQKKAEHGRETVDRMLESIEEISQSNEAIMNQINQSNAQMSDIVNVIQEIGNKTKVINEIVFQTKLLSFNASVEAARAGEHGKGFAVVAEEVGNLAQMSGNAAKEISDMLNNSIPKVESIVKETKTKVEALISQAKTKVDSGVNVAKECSELLKEIVQNITHVSGLAQEISNASKEQAQGVAEINKAMGQLDSVTQQNAATSEETASAAEELSAQAVSLREAVEQLVETVQGTSSSVASESTRTNANQAKVVPIFNKSKKTEFKSAAGDGMTPSREDSGFREA